VYRWDFWLILPNDRAACREIWVFLRNSKCSMDDDPLGDLPLPLGGGTDGVLADLLMEGGGG